MFNLIRKDILLTTSNKSNILIIILFVPLMNLILGVLDPGRTITMSIIFCTYITTTLSFVYDMTSKPQTLILSLPVKKREVVISKYIAIFTNYIFAVILTGGYLWIISLFGSRTVDSFEFYLIRDTLRILIISLSISLPLHFSLSPKVANFVNGFILISIINVIRTNSSGINGTFSNDSAGNIQLVLSTAVVVVFSMIISIFLYEEKDLV